MASHGWLPATKATSFSIDQNNILTNKFKSLYLNRKKFSAYSMKWKEYKFASWFKILNFWQWHFLFRAYIRRSINISLHYFITAFNYLDQTNISTHFSLPEYPPLDNWNNPIFEIYFCRLKTVGICAVEGKFDALGTESLKKRLFV